MSGGVSMNEKVSDFNKLQNYAREIHFNSFCIQLQQFFNYFFPV